MPKSSFVDFKAVKASLTMEQVPRTERVEVNERIDAARTIGSVFMSRFFAFDLLSQRPENRATLQFRPIS